MKRDLIDNSPSEADAVCFKVFRSSGVERRFDEKFLETSLLQHLEFGQLPSSYHDEHGEPIAFRSSADRSKVFVVLPEELDGLAASIELRELNEQTVMED